MKPEQIIIDIIREQSNIIGETLAKQMAINSGVIEFKSGKIEELKIIDSNYPVVFDKLINSYKQLFGQASVEVCLGVINKFPKNETKAILPESLSS